MIEQGIQSLLSSAAAVSTLVSTRIYPVFVPQDSPLPCLSYQVVSGSSDYSVDGTAEIWKRIQFDAWGAQYADVKNIQNAVHAVLDGYNGVLPDGTLVWGAFRGLELDEFEADARIYRSMTEYSFHFVE